jgi:hypothetical protein
VALAGVGMHGAAIGDSGEAGEPLSTTTTPTSITEVGMVEITTVTTPGALDHTGLGLTDHTPTALTAEGSGLMVATVAAVFPVMTAGAIPTEAMRLAIA